MVHNNQDPALAARLALQFPAEFDVQRSHITIFIDLDTKRYVKTVHPAASFSGRDWIDKYNWAAYKQAESLWLEKYGTIMPKDVEAPWAETLAAWAIEYPGTRALSAEELVAVREDHGDFTLDMLWLLVEGLGWSPGVPVAEDDPGWLVIWGEEENGGGSGYIDIVRSVLGMPEIPYPERYDWLPPAVAALY